MSTEPKSLRIAKLRNGAEEAFPLIALVTMQIRDLFEGKGWVPGEGPLPPVMVYELVAKARDRNHKFFGDIGKHLAKTTFFDDEEGHMHDSIRNIVISSFEGELTALQLINPLHESELL